MEGYGRWSLLSMVLMLVVGVSMVVRGVGPEWYSYASVVAVFSAAAAWGFRFVVDVRKAKKNPAPESVETPR